MQLKKEYDVFIAYHGSYEKDGSAGYADKIYNYLTQLGKKCFSFLAPKKILIKPTLLRL